MSLEVHIQEVDTHLAIKAVGQYTLDGLHDLFGMAKEECEKRGYRKVILDFTEVAGSIPVLDMLVLGEHCAREFKHPLRTAIVSTEGGLDRFFENVGQNRGLQIVVVSDQSAAIEWLK